MNSNLWEKFFSEEKEIEVSIKKEIIKINVIFFIIIFSPYIVGAYFFN
jgi:hypothetical protein